MKKSSGYVAGKRHWMHVTCTARLTHSQVHASRGQEALEAIGILPHYAGTSVHDGFGSYFQYACQHAICNVHVLRELTYLSEEQGVWWAAKLKLSSYKHSLGFSPLSSAGYSFRRRKGEGWSKLSTIGRKAVIGIRRLEERKEGNKWRNEHLEAMGSSFRR